MDFRFEALDASGKTIRGQIAAASEREAGRLLREQSLRPLEVVPAATNGTSRTSAKRANSQERALAIRELAILLQAGVPLAEAVESIGASHAQSAVGPAFLRLHDKLRAGMSFSSGLQALQLGYPDYLVQLALAGEQTGRLAQSLQSAADQLEYEMRVRSELRSALLYPAVLVASGIAATLLIFVAVVPRFAGMLKGNRGNLPDISVWVLSAGLFVKDNLGWIALSVGALGAAAAAFIARPENRNRILQAASRAHGLGRWIVESETGRWAGMLGTLLEHRVPILRAMEIAEQGVHLADMRSRLQRAMREVRGGRKLADALEGVRLLSVTGLNLVRVGERSGELAAMLRALAAIHENEGRLRLKRFLIVLEPAAILLIGGVIGFVMAAVMLAITSLSNVRL